MSSKPGVARPGLHRSEHGLLLIVGDAFVASIALAMALWVWSFTTGFPFNFQYIVERPAWLLAVPLWLSVIAPTRAWHAAHALRETLSGVLSAAGVVLAVYVAVYFYAPPAVVARLPAVYFVWEAVLLTVGWRLIYLFILGRGTFARRTIVVGSGARARAALEIMGRVARDTLVIAVVSDRLDEARADSPIRPWADLDGLVRDQGVVEIVIALDTPPTAALSERLLRLQEQGLEVVPFAAEYEQRFRRVAIDHLDTDWAFTSLPEWVRTRDASRLAKRAMDLTGGLIGLAILIVLAIPIALAIWLDSGRPILYRQQRVGRGGRRLVVLKFRTMRVGAEADGAQWAVSEDPRTTRVGRWLRRARLDEWPQILNVLRGDMSLVGPRPERPEFADALSERILFYRTRLMVEPGLTGWAQVNADYGDSVEGQARKLEYDLYYIKHRSLLFDLWILVRTVGTVLGLRGQ